MAFPGAMAHKAKGPKVTLAVGRCAKEEAMLELGFEETAGVGRPGCTEW